MKNTPTLIIISTFYAVVSSLMLNYKALAVEVEVKKIDSTPFVKVIKRTGKLDFKRTLNLSFKTSGYLSKLSVDEGENFTKGQILAELDSFELVTEKNASYARLLQAKKNVTRIKSLLAKKLSSEQALDDAKTQVETTRAAHKLAQYNVDKSQLIAPFDGVVLARFSELSELQNPNKVVMQLAAKNDNLVVRVALTSEEVGLIKYHQKVEVSFLQGVVIGKVSKVAITSDPASQLYNIEVFLADINAKTVTVGQQANVVIKSETGNYIYRLPISSLNGVNEHGKALVTIQDTNNMKAFQRKSFFIEQISNDYIYLATRKSALPLNVVTHGWQQLKNVKTETVHQEEVIIKASAEIEN
jgi:RND family efflux transporter MFP subunit